MRTTLFVAYYLLFVLPILPLEAHWSESQGNGYGSLGEDSSNNIDTLGLEKYFVYGPKNSRQLAYIDDFAPFVDLDLFFISDRTVDSESLKNFGIEETNLMIENYRECLDGFIVTHHRNVSGQSYPNGNQRVEIEFLSDIIFGPTRLESRFIEDPENGGLKKECGPDGRCRYLREDVEVPVQQYNDLDVQRVAQEGRAIVGSGVTVVVTNLRINEGRGYVGANGGIILSTYGRPPQGVVWEALRLLSEIREQGLQGIYLNQSVMSYGLDATSCWRVTNVGNSE